MMIPQVTNGLPQLGLRPGAEDFGRRALPFGIRRAEQDAPPVRTVVEPAYREPDGDWLTVEAYRREVVHDDVGRTGGTGAAVTCRLYGHARPFGLVWSKIRTDLGYAILRAPYYYRGTNGTGENVITKRTSAAMASHWRERGSGRYASSTGGCPSRPRASSRIRIAQRSQPGQNG